VHTNSDGRGTGLSEGLLLTPGVYRVSFDTKAYYEACGLQYSFYPQPAIDFTVTDDSKSQHFHIPLLLSPFSYTTYRGS
jgi:5-hydroxyisourate hydrolase